MKKLLTFLMFYSLIVSPVYADYYYNAYINQGNNPGGLNEDNVNHMTGNNPPSGWNVLNELAEVFTPKWSNQMLIPFDFVFNKDTFEKITISNSGVLTFSDDPGNPVPFGNVALPSNDVPDNSICILGVTPNLGEFEGARVVTKVFGSSPNRQFWVTYNTFGATSMGDDGYLTFSIVLEETTNNIYIVDQRSGGQANDNLALSLGLQIDETLAYSVDGSPQVGSFAESNASGTSSSYYKFVPGQRPASEVSLQYLVLPSHVSKQDGSVEIKGVITNFGADPLSSLTATYTIDGENPVTDVINLPDIATNEQTEITHPINWDPDITKTKTVELTVSEPNGETDPNPEDNVASGDVLVAEELFDRRVLVETFTSSTCPPCRPGAVQLENAFSQFSDDEYASIRYQVNWPGAGDPYYTAEVGNRRTHYGIVAAPNTSIDGGPSFNPNAGAPTIVSMINQAADIPAFVIIDGTAEVEGETISFDIDVKVMSELPSGMRLQVAVVEKVTYNNVATNGQTEFHTVMKKMIPHQNGTILPAFSSGDEYNFSDSYEFHGDYRLPENSSDAINHGFEHSVEDFGNLKLVVFVQNHSTREVFQSFKTDIVGDNVQLSKKDAQHKLKVYPNPATDQLNIETANIDGGKVIISNIQGQIMYESSDAEVENHQHQINTSKYPKGIYLINVSNNEHSITEKVVIGK